MPQHPTPAGVGRRILVADDDDDSATSLAMILEFSGHQVSIAHSGRQAVELAEAQRPQVIVLDIGMPVMNGYEAAKAIRAKPWSKHVILIALTGWGETDDRQRALQAGFDAHCVKPADPMEVIDLVARLTARQIPLAD